MPAGTLSGSLEDLGLGEILQILSLSRKSGVLHLVEGGGRELSLFIREGLVIVARPNPVVQPLLQFVERMALPPPAKQKLFTILKEKRLRGEAWSRFFVRELSLEKNRARELALRYLVYLVGQAFAWEGGMFEFVLMDPGSEEFQKVLHFPLFPSVEEGVNAQFLAMEAARLQDESSLSQPYSFGTLPPRDLQVAPGLRTTPGEPQEGQGAGQLLLVDDQEEIVEATGAFLKQRGYRVAIATSIEMAMEVIERSEEGNWVVFADLVMPKRDRSGLLGGLELAEMLRNHPRVTRVYLSSDTVYAGLEEKARLMNIQGVLMKPARREWIQNLKEAAARYGERIAQAAGAPGGGEEKEEEFKELEAGVGELDLEDPLQSLFAQENLIPLPRARSERGVELLRRMVEELLTPEGETEVSLLILRFASHLFQRVILFVVTGEELKGLGQVGLSGENANRLVRELRIPLKRGTIFDRVIEERKGFSGKPPAQPLLHRLFTRLGGPVPFEIVLAPVVVGGRTVALLYADQVPTQAPLRELEVLEVFLAQAGMALERTYLRKQLLKQTGKGGT